MNGGIVIFVGIYLFIVMFGMLIILFGLVFLIICQLMGFVFLFFEDFVYGWLGMVFYGIIFMVVFYVLVGFFFWKICLGLWIYVVGDNENVVVIFGVLVRVMKLIVYVLFGLLVVVIVIYICGWFGVGDLRVGVGFDLKLIILVIVGGIFLVGCCGGVFGIVFVVIVFVLLVNVLNFMNVFSFYQWIVEGFIIIVVVFIFVGGKSK